MKFLLNMNIPRDLGKWLSGEGHECRHLSDIGMYKVSNLEVVEEARRDKEVIITHDLDYGRIITFSGKSSPSVIIFRLRNTHPRNLLNRIINLWYEIEEPLFEGAIVLVEDFALRIHRLPI
jgi:predicted nuclease of predicted toxin-antitoxin system